ncbi:MAG: MerR family transcriptional regulator [Ignavibacteriaceae bacterium]
MTSIFLQQELLTELKISAPDLLEWESSKLIKPSGYTEDKIPFYTGETFDQCRQIQKLTELGYGTDEILKIIKKVGLPKDSGRKPNKKNNEKYITVGELAEKIGVSTRTIKHWEDKGIIDSDMRSEGGFRLYSEIYVYLCSLILDLQNFGYSLDEIKLVSDHFRDYWSITNNMDVIPKESVSNKIEEMQQDIEKLLNKIASLKTGIERWEELLKKKKKEITALKTKNSKRD